MKQIEGANKFQVTTTGSNISRLRHKKRANEENGVGILGDKNIHLEMMEEERGEVWIPKVL